MHPNLDPGFWKKNLHGKNKDKQKLLSMRIGSGSKEPRKMIHKQG